MSASWRRDLPAWVAPVAVAAFGLLAATGVVYLTARNPQARPAGLAVPFRVLIIGTLTATAVYAQTSTFHRRMAVLLAAACVVTSLWLLNGSDEPVPFSFGMLFVGPALVIAYYLLLAHPSGVLHSQPDRRFIAIVGTAVLVLWIAALLISPQPLFRTPLLGCAPHCPRNVFYLGLDRAVPGLPDVTRALWVVLTLGAMLLINRRWRLSSGPLRRSLLPVWVVALLATVLLPSFFVAQATGAGGAATAAGVAYVVLWAVIPLAILAGLASERLFMGQALASFVTKLAKDPAADPRILMAETLQDPSLSIAYARPAGGGYVDFFGAEIEPPESAPGRDLAWIDRGGRRIAALTYDQELGDQRRFIEAAADAAVMRLEQAQLLADLRATTANLTASRLRLVETAQAERKRIERDLHDSVQQDLLGLRLKLDLAAEAMISDPARGQQIISDVGQGLDDVLNSLRDLARGIYPQLLLDRGVVEAVRSAARRAPVPVSVRAEGVGRFSEDIEVAVYYGCLEAVQNVIKHAGPDAKAQIRLRQDSDGALRFEVVDDGFGFDADAVGSERGLTNMRDRMEAVGGTLAVSSRPGTGTRVRGRVPPT